MDWIPHVVLLVIGFILLVGVASLVMSGSCRESIEDDEQMEYLKRLNRANSCRSEVTGREVA